MGPKLHVLILNIDYPPDTSDTALIFRDIALAMAKRHRVTALAGRPFYNPTERHPYYLFRRVISGNLTVERVGSTAFDRRSMAGRVLNYLSYLSLALLRSLAVKPDVVVAMTDPPLAGLVGALVAFVWKRPFVYNIRDLHPDMAVASGFVKPGLLVSMWDKMHQWVMRRADLIIVLGEDMRERVINKKDIQPQRVVVVRNGAPTSAIPVRKQHPTMDLIRGNSEFTVLHAGNLGFGGAFHTMVAAASRLEAHPIGFVLIGDGAACSRLEVQAAGLSNVRFLSYRPSSEIPLVLAAGDL